jgi:hypothetical protein
VRDKQVHIEILSVLFYVSGVVLPIRSSGTGLLGCGLPSQDGVELLEALKWAGETLNHKEEDSESFIPGVKLGKRLIHK